MTNTFIILPNQLFKKNLYNKNDKIILWEHPQYFTKFNYNKKKLILHRASMKYQYDYLKENGFSVKYIEFNEKFNTNIKEYQLYDPIDKIKLPGKYEIIETPNFLMTKDDYQEYRNKTDKYFFNAFYMWGKKQINYKDWDIKKWDKIVKMKSQDKLNRKKMPKNIKIPELPPNNFNNYQKYINDAIKYVEKYFKNNYGNVENFVFPISHSDAKKWLQNFIKIKFNNFGEYQDSIIKNESYLFHSILSTSINIGLLNPNDIITEILNYNNKIPNNSLEGYIRQLFWREYQRYCYIYYNFNNKNYFGNNKKLNKDWYNGTLDIEPVDDCIVKAFDTGYLHHIERLMIVGNFMNLSGIYPEEGFKWFMEFSCDSYEWVMCQNVYDMVFFISGGDTMRRPYISSSNYILKMSNYKKGEWSDKWDNLYHKFLEKNREKLWKFRYYFSFLTKKR